MTNLGRVPRLIAPLHAYINSTAGYLAVHWQRLGILSAELTRWQEYRSNWNCLYTVYSDKEESRTMAVTSKIHRLQKQFTEFASRILIRIQGMPDVNNDDAGVFNFVLRRKKPVHNSAAITELPFFGITPLGGGIVKFRVFSQHDSTRGRKLTGADIEIYYHISSVNEEIKFTDLEKHHNSTKAIFLLDCGQSTPGKKLHVSMRWVVLRNPLRNGPWSTIQYMSIV